MRSRPNEMRPATWALLIASALVARSAPAGIAEYTVTETGRGSFALTAEAVRRIAETQVAPNGRHIATLESAPAAIENLPTEVIASRGSFVRRDGKPGATWQEIRKGSVAWSADGERLMYVARKNDDWHVVVDETPGPPFAKIGRAGFAGPDGTVIYSAQRGDADLVMLDGSPYPGCAGAEWWWIDSSGDRIACVIPKGERWQLAVEGVPTVEWDYVPFFGFTEPDGEHYFYIAHDEGKQRMVFDAVPGPVCDAVGKVKCDNRGSCAAWVKVGDKWHVTRGDSMGPGYDQARIWNMDLLMSPDGNRIAYITRDGPGGDRQEWTIHVDGRDFGPYQGFGTPVWGGDGAHWAVIVGRGQKRLVVVDGVEGPEFDMVVANGPFFSPDGSRVGYFVQEENGVTLMLDGEKAITMDKIIGPNLAFSRDGAHWALVGERAGVWYLVLDGELAENGYADVRTPGPVFADDGSISFIARKGDGIVCATYGVKGRE